MNETSAKITWSEGLIRRIEVAEPSPKADMRSPLRHFCVACTPPQSVPN